MDITCINDEELISRLKTLHSQLPTEQKLFGNLFIFSEYKRNYVEFKKIYNELTNRGFDITPVIKLSIQREPRSFSNDRT